MSHEPSDPRDSEELSALRKEHAARLKKQREDLGKEKKDEELEADWFQDRGGYRRDLLPPEFDQYVPPEIRQRFVAAQREALIGVRALIDYWIDRSGDVTARARRPARWENPTIAEKPK